MYDDSKRKFCWPHVYILFLSFSLTISPHVTVKVITCCCKNNSFFTWVCSYVPLQKIFPYLSPSLRETFTKRICLKACVIQTACSCSAACFLSIWQKLGQILLEYLLVHVSLLKTVLRFKGDFFNCILCKLYIKLYH